MLGQDALLVQANTYHDTVESMLFMMGLVYLFSTCLQTYQLFQLKRKKYVAEYCIYAGMALTLFVRANKLRPLFLSALAKLHLLTNFDACKPVG